MSRQVSTSRKASAFKWGPENFCRCGAARIPTQCQDFLSDEKEWECARCHKPLPEADIPAFFKSYEREAK